MNRFKNLNINQPVHTEDVNYVLRPFEGSMKPGDPTGLNICLQEIKEIVKETYKLNISISNAKDIVDNFISLSNKYVWGYLTFMV